MKVVVFIKGTDEKRVYEPAEVVASDHNDGVVVIDDFAATFKTFGPTEAEDFDKVVIFP